MEMVFHRAKYFPYDAEMLLAYIHVHVCNVQYIYNYIWHFILLLSLNVIHVYLVLRSVHNQNYQQYSPFTYTYNFITFLGMSNFNPLLIIELQYNHVLLTL